MEYRILEVVYFVLVFTSKLLLSLSAALTVYLPIKKKQNRALTSKDHALDTLIQTQEKKNKKGWIHPILVSFWLLLEF